MANFVFVHGGNVSGHTWNQAVLHRAYPEKANLGGTIWDEIAKSLRSQGHHVYTPTLSDEYEHSLSDHVRQIAQLIQTHHLSDVILVGHSYGGMVITGLAENFSDKIRLLVYLDAALPENGQSLFDILKLAQINTKNLFQGFPSAYTEKILLKNMKINQLPKYYIRCLDSEFTAVTALAKKKILADSIHWHYQEIKAGHLPMATNIIWIANFLARLGNDGKPL